jgi:hypothetical protein
MLEYNERTHHKNGDGTNIFPQSGRRKQNDCERNEGTISRSPANRTRDTKRNLDTNLQDTLSVRAIETKVSSI